VLHERFINSNSFWKPFFDSLPDFREIPLLYPFEDLMELEGTSLFDEVVAAKEHILELHGKVRFSGRTVL